MTDELKKEEEQQEETVQNDTTVNTEDSNENEKAEKEPVNYGVNEEASAKEEEEVAVAEAEEPVAEETSEEEKEDDEKSLPVYDGHISGDIYKLDDLQEQSEDYTEGEFNQLVDMYEGTLNAITEKEVVTGRVIGVDEKYVIVDIGFKSEGIVQLNEFRNADEIKVGDEIEVFLDRVEDREGQLVLSRRKADTLRAWERIEQAYEDGSILEGNIKRRIKGGMVVDLDGIDAFLPGSQIDVRPVRDFDAYVGKNMEFMVVKLNMGSENVVVSHRAIVESDLEEQRAEILASMKPGQILEGHVKNITDFGVFIDLGGVDGLLHITDLSWGRVEHPSEIVKLDQKINVVVLDFDEETKRISLGLKQLQPHPWEEIEKKYPENDRVQGRVVSIADYGAFVELEKGVEGLVHISEMSWTQHIKHPSQLVEKNQIIECVVLNVNKDEHKISLGIKQLEKDPWENLLDRYPIGSRHEGTVRNLTNFGVFVELEPGIDGLIHISDLSWTNKINHPSEVVNKGDKIEIVIMSVDFDNRRITLGHKQIEANPWEKIAENYAPGTEFEAEITKITDKGLFVKLDYGIEGFLPTREAEFEGEFSEAFKEGDKVKTNVVEIDESNHNVKLSQKSKPEPKAKKKKSESRGSSRSAATGALTLGEMSGLEDLRSKLLEKEAQEATEPEPEQESDEAEEEEEKEEKE